jgi:hypothetical protein
MSPDQFQSLLREAGDALAPAQPDIRQIVAVAAFLGRSPSTVGKWWHRIQQPQRADLREAVNLLQGITKVAA